MRTNIPLLSLTVAASGAVTGRRFCSPTGAIATAALNAIGVFQYDQDDTKQVAVDVLGTAIVEAGEAIAEGGLVEVGASGKAAAKAAGITVARVAPGSSAAADGDLIEVILIPN